MVKTSSSTEKTPLKKGAWSPEEDRKLTAYIKRYKIWNWTEMSKAAGLARTGKSCRLRWVNYLRPDIKRGNFSKEEEETIITLHETLGNRWSAIAAKLPSGRTDNEVKNYWHTHLKKRLKADSTSSTSVIPELQEAGDEASWKNLSESDVLASPEPAKSISKIDDSKNTVVSPQQPITSSTGPANFEIGKDQKIVNEGINIDKTSSHETFIEELQSLWSQQGDFFYPPPDDQLIGPSTNSPIWQYDFYKEFDDCYDWVHYMDKTFGNS